MKNLFRWTILFGYTLFLVLVCHSQIRQNNISSNPENVSKIKSEVRIKGKDGFNLKGEFYPAKSEAPGVLLLHQCNRQGKLSGYENLAQELNKRGFNALILDFRSYGGSINEEFSPETRRKSNAFEHFPDDVESAYKFLVSQKNVLKTNVGVVGASCGGDQGIILAKKYTEVKAFVFLSSGIEEEFQTLSSRPFFLVSSENDRYKGVLPSLQKVFKETSHNLTRLLIYKGEKHGTPLFEQDENLEATIADWLKSILM